MPVAVLFCDRSVGDVFREATAAEYTEARHAALDGEERNVASTAAQDALEQYAGWTLGEWKPADFPRLAGNA
jgi:hypothetical protein